MRLDIKEYALRIAEIAALRSEDPVRQVGAVALTSDNRIIATAYNGAPGGIEFTMKQWHDEEWRLRHVIHAEQNLCSLLRRGDAEWVAITVTPCVSCLKLLVAHGIELIVARKLYTRDNTMDVARKFKIKVELCPAHR